MLKATDAISRIRIPESVIGIPGSGFVLKCHGSTTLRGLHYKDFFLFYFFATGAWTTLKIRCWFWLFPSPPSETYQMGKFNSLTGFSPSFANDLKNSLYIKKKPILLPAFGFGFWLLALQLICKYGPDTKKENQRRQMRQMLRFLKLVLATLHLKAVLWIWIRSRPGTGSVICYYGSRFVICYCGPGSSSGSRSGSLLFIRDLKKFQHFYKI
jgi:hypothetical protein